MSATPQHPTSPSQRPPVNLPDMPLLVAVPTAAHLLGIGATLAWDLVRAGDIPSVKLGRRVLVPRAALERLAHPHVSGPDQEPVTDTDTPHTLIPVPRRGPARSEPSPSGPARLR